MKLTAEFTLPEKARRVADLLTPEEWWAEDVQVLVNAGKNRTTALQWTVDVRGRSTKRGAQQDYFDMATRLCGYHGSTRTYKVPLRAELEVRPGDTLPLVWERECPYVP